MRIAIKSYKKKFKSLKLENAVKNAFYRKLEKIVFQADIKKDFIKINVVLFMKINGLA